MGLLQRYIAKTILTSTLLVLLILLGLYTFMDFIAELEDLGKGEYHLTEAASYMLLSMPKRIYELLPIAALLGSVLGLGTLANQGELVAMRAAGVSVHQINKAVMIVALCLMIVAVFVGEILRPPLEQRAREIQSMAQTGTVSSRSERGFWTRDGLHFNHIRSIQSDGRFADILIYEFDKQHRLRVVTKAQEAYYEGPTWVLSNVVQSMINEQGVQVRSIAHARWRSQLNPGMVNIVLVPPEFLPLWDLLNYIHYLKDNLQAAAQYEIAFWMKIMMPVSSAVMVFLAVPFVFGSLRSTPIGGRILVGSLLGISFHLLNQSFQHLGIVFGLWPWLTAAFPTVVFAILGVFLMRRIY